VEVKLAFDQGDGRSAIEQFFIPGQADEAMLKEYARYIAVITNNRLVTSGCKNYEIEPPALAELVKQVFSCNINSYLNYQGQTNGRVSVGDMLRRYHNYQPSLMPDRALEPRLGREPAHILTLNVGQTRFRAGIVRLAEGQLPEIVSPLIDEPTYLAYNLPGGGNVSAPLSQMVWSAKYLADQFPGRVDGVGVSVAARTKAHQFINIPLGVVRDFDEVEMMLWGMMPNVLSSMFGAVPSVIENDGAAQATFYARALLKAGSLLLLRFGTTLCASVTDGQGWPVEGFNELNKVIIDPGDSSGDPYYWGRAGKYLSFSGIIYIAKALGVERMFPELADKDMPKRLPAWLGQGDESQKGIARQVYARIGAYAAQYVRELRENDYSINNVALVGSHISGPPAEIVAERINHDLKGKAAVSVLTPDRKYAESGANFGLALIAGRLI